MACRDCKWWNELEPRGAYEAMGDCEWVAPVPLPFSFIEDGVRWMQESDGERCPQFNAREESTDGE